MTALRRAAAGTVLAAFLVAGAHAHAQSVGPRPIDVSASANRRANSNLPTGPGTAEPGYVVDRWMTDDGLPQNSINAILQSRDGYLWLATNGGVARFDGVTFTTLNSGSRSGLRSDRILSLAEDGRGRVWVGTENGLSRFDGRSFTTFSTAEGMPGAAISALTQAPDGGVLFGTRAGAFGHIDDNGIRVIVPKNGGLGNGVGKIIVDQSHTVFVYSATGVWRVDMKSGALERVAAPRRARQSSALGADPRVGIWAATDSGLTHITGDTRVEYPIRYLIGDSTKMCRRGPDCGPWADNVDISVLTSDGDRGLLLGTRAGEIWHFHPDSVHTPGFLRRIKSAERGTTNHLILDREGNIWAGSDVSGLTRARTALFHVYTMADGLATDVIEAVFADHNDRMWVGGNCIGLSMQDSAQHFRYVNRANGLHHECIWSLAEDTAGAMWMGTYGGGLGKWKDGRVAGWYTTADGLPSDVVLALFRDRSGLLWIGTENGLATYDGAHFKLHPLPIADATPDVRTIYQARDGSMWLGSVQGLIHLTGSTAVEYTTKNGLPNNFVRAVYEDAAGSLWIGTYGGGLARLRDGKFVGFSTADGLHDNFISSLIEDRAGNLWMSSNRGVFRVARASLEKYAAGALPRIQSVVYGHNDGMLSSETNGGFEPSVTRTRDGRLWYPTMRGVAVIDPALAAANPVPPAVVLEQVKVNGRETSPDSALRVGPGATDLEIAYSGVSFTAPDAVTFRYKLENWDKNWIEAGTRRFASYSRLTPGSYRFLVLAANRDGVWSTTPTVIPVDVRPHLWQTWWFRLLLFVLLVALVLLAMRARVRRVRLATEAAEREASRRQVTAILESITDGFIALDSSWCFTYVNRTAETLLHESRADLMGRNFFDAFPRALGTPSEEALRTVMSSRQPVAFEAADQPGYGQWLGVHAYPSEDGISIYFSDITPRKLAEETLRTQSLRDELTGVFNRRGFLAHAEQQSLTALRSRKPFDIVFIDMDGMKRINDTLGHPAGDSALCETVEILRETFRESDVIGRLGGDEFAVLVLDSGEAEIALVMERLKEKLAAHNARDGREFSLSLSLGISRFNPLQPVAIEELIEAADRRMYEEKRAKGAARSA